MTTTTPRRASAVTLEHHVRLPARDGKARTRRGDRSIAARLERVGLDGGRVRRAILAPDPRPRLFHRKLGPLGFTIVSEIFLTTMKAFGFARRGMDWASRAPASPPWPFVGGSRYPTPEPTRPGSRADRTQEMDTGGRSRRNPWLHMSLATPTAKDFGGMRASVRGDASGIRNGRGTGYHEAGIHVRPRDSGVPGRVDDAPIPDRPGRARALRQQLSGTLPMQDVLTTAIEMHQAGRLGEAATLYQKVLRRRRRTPRHCTCWACCTISRAITPGRSS